jgi:mycothione reductase
LVSVDYLTSETILSLKAAPKSLIIIGGGYIGVEYAHFFEAMGTEVTILEMGPRLLPAEETEVSAFLQMALARRMTVHTQCAAATVEKPLDGGVVVHLEHGSTGQKSQLKAEMLLVAAGRQSNADLLKVEKCGIAIDDNGFIKANARMETNVKGIYAVGDANGREMFTHTSHAEAAVAAANGIHGQQEVMDYTAAPHAVFTHPQVASVGLTEEEAAKKHKIMVGRADYGDITLGQAMMQQEGFAKVIMERGSGKILGCHIIGPWASALIQEVVNAMARKGGGFDDIARGIHIHPALPELVVRAFYNAAEAE